MRVVGLSLHLWSHEVFKRIDNGCGGFVAVDEDTDSLTELQWAQILVKLAVRVLLCSGCCGVGVLFLSFVLFGVPTGRNYGEGVSKEGEEEGGSSRVACFGSQR